MLLKNISPLGELDLPLINREGDNGTYGEPDADGYSARKPTPGSGCLEAGEEFDVPDDVARELLKQDTNFAVVGKSKTPKDVS